MKNLFFSASLVLVALQIRAQADTFVYSGATQYYVVPPCIYSVRIDALGAQGGGNGGNGGSASGDRAVNPGDTLWVNVGGMNGYNGGGTGANPGGGASDVRAGNNLSTNRILVAGGGGGRGGNGSMSCSGQGGPGGAGGGTTGNAGGNGSNCGNGGGGGGGGGANTSTGGIGGVSGSGCSGPTMSANSGGFNIGGAGSFGALSCGGSGGGGNGGGGGGGYYGGGGGSGGGGATGGGGGGAGGGGGGSSYLGGVTDSSTISGVNAGDGLVIITPGTPVVAAAPVISGTASACEGEIVSFICSSVQNATSYTWTSTGCTIISGQGSDSISVQLGSTTAIVYAEAVTPCGITLADTFNIAVNLLPTVTAASAVDTACLDDFMIALNGTPAGGSWTGPGVSGNNFDPMTAGAGTHVITYDYTDGNGCSAFDTASVFVDLCLNVAENGPNDFIIIPNPNMGSFSIEFPDSYDAATVEIVDITGKVILCSQMYAVTYGSRATIDCNEQANGIYFVRVTVHGESSMCKMIIAK